MSLESLDNLFNSSKKHQMLNRAFLAQKVREVVESFVPGPVKVIIGDPRVMIVCADTAQAAAVKIKLPKIRERIKGETGRDFKDISLKITPK